MPASSPDDHTRGFSKEERLRFRGDYLRVGAEGQKASSPHFIVVMACSDGARTRVGLTVSRKVGNAVARNLVKRRLREYYRHNKDRFLPADYNIIARSGADGLTAAETCRQLDRSLRRLHPQHDS